jgi:hypothetical protein
MKHLLFDKSAFEGLGEDAHGLARSMYSTITSSTLLLEIAGDLRPGRKPKPKKKPADERAADLARKFGDRVETHEEWETLCLRSLHGADVPYGLPSFRNTIQAFLSDGRMLDLRTQRADGSSVPIHKNWVESLASLSWTAEYPPDTRVFKDEMAALWGRLNGVARVIKAPANATDAGQQRATELAVVAEADRVLDDPAHQEQLIRWLIYGFGCTSEHHARRIFQGYWDARYRWEFAGRPLLKASAPYAHYCARVRLLYLVGEHVWPKGRELNDLADIEYLYLLPFTDVFASNDKFVRAIARHLLRADQLLTCSCRLRKELTGECRDAAKCEREHAASLP